MMKRYAAFCAASASLFFFACTSVDEDSGSSRTSGDGDGDYHDASGDGDLAYGDGDGDLGVSGDIYYSSGSGGASSFVDPEEPPTMDNFEPVGTNPFVVVGHDPLSTFAADVDTASYDLFRAYVNGGALPNPDSIRLEEFVNYFDYDYEKPELEGEHPFAIHLAAAPNLISRNTQVLRVGIQGVEIPADTAKKPANLVFLVDASGSMSQEMDMVQAVLKQTLELLDPTDTLSIVTYASNAGVLLPATPVSDTIAINVAINSLTAGGSTNGAGGIDAAYAQAESAFIDGGINHVLICTDGDFNVGPSSTEALEALIIEKRKSGITLTALGFGSGNYNDAMMERISNAGNGIYGYIGSTADAEKYVAERMLQTLIHIAKDMKIQVEFNPEHVYAYRLLGYENRAIADEDFRDDVVDAGEIGSGHSVTALYELVLMEADMPTYEGAPALDDGEAFAGTPEVDPADLVLVKVRYKAPDASEEDAATEVTSSLSPAGVADGFAAADSDLQWAVAVASYAEILKQSPYADPEALAAIRLILAEQSDKDADHEEFLALFDKANAL